MDQPSWSNTLRAALGSCFRFTRSDYALDGTSPDDEYTHTDDSWRDDDADPHTLSLHSHSRANPAAHVEAYFGGVRWIQWVWDRQGERECDGGSEGGELALHGTPPISPRRGGGESRDSSIVPPPLLAASTSFPAATSTFASWGPCPRASPCRRQQLREGRKTKNPQTSTCPRLKVVTSADVARRARVSSALSLRLIYTAHFYPSAQRRRQLEVDGAPPAVKIKAGISEILAASPNRNRHTRHVDCCLAPLDRGGGEYQRRCSISPHRPTCRTLPQLSSLSFSPRALICPPSRISNSWRTKTQRISGRPSYARLAPHAADEEGRAGRRAGRVESGTRWSSDAARILEVGRCIRLWETDEGGTSRKRIKARTASRSVESHPYATSFPRRHHLLPSPFLLDFPPLVSVGGGGATIAHAAERRHLGAELHPSSLRQRPRSPRHSPTSPDTILALSVDLERRWWRRPPFAYLPAVACADDDGGGGMPGLRLHPRLGPRPAARRRPGAPARPSARTSSGGGISRSPRRPAYVRVLSASRIERAGSPWKLRVEHRVPILITISQTENDGIYLKDKSATSTLAPPRLDFVLHPMSPRFGPRSVFPLPPRHATTAAVACQRSRPLADAATSTSTRPSSGVLWGDRKACRGGGALQGVGTKYSIVLGLAPPRLPLHWLVSSTLSSPPLTTTSFASHTFSAQSSFPASPSSASGGAVGDSFGALAHHGAYPHAYFGAEGREHEFDGTPGAFGSSSL
ncbi:hypothetical protein C8R45DRAFT_1223400 [Mycena sanguinolenta]|nr:hypothetical protein C8R45DRAFT_1223400 [Mycena sanguinolenta]